MSSHWDACVQLAVEFPKVHTSSGYNVDAGWDPGSCLFSFFFFKFSNHSCLCQWSTCHYIYPVCVTFCLTSRTWLGSQSHGQHSENDTKVDPNTVSVLLHRDYLDCITIRGQCGIRTKPVHCSAWVRILEIDHTQWANSSTILDLSDIPFCAASPP